MHGWKDRLQVFKQTWSWRHVLGVVLVSSLVVSLIVVSRSIATLGWYAGQSESLVNTLYFSWLLLGGLFTLFTPLGTTLIVLFGLLTGVQTVLLWQYVRQARGRGGRKAAALSLSGSIAALFGIGCASCGTAILFTIVNLLGASGVLLWLPLHGKELSIIGILLLTYSGWYLLGALSQPRVCHS